MKRILCAALAAAMLTTGASAYQVPHQNEKDNIIVHYDANCDPQAQAEMLHKLGLLSKTGEDFALDKTLTNAEAAVMVCGLMGGAEEAAKGGFSHPFTDVPAWANNAVGWLYQHTVNCGISAKKIGANQNITAEHFKKLLSRAICGGDDFVGVLLTDEETAALKDKPFLRSYAVAMSVRALTHSGGADYKTILQRLSEKGYFTMEQFADAAWGVFQPYFRGDDAAMGYLPYAKCSVEGLYGVYNLIGADGMDELPYLYAKREIDGQLELYRLDWRTLSSTFVGKIPLVGMDGSVSYAGSAGGRDYLVFRRSSEDELHYSLYSTDGVSLRKTLPESVLGGEEPRVIEGSNQTVLSTKAGVCQLGENGAALTRYPSKEGETKTLYAGENAYVIQNVDAQKTTVSAIDSKTGRTLKAFDVPRDADHARTIEYQKNRGAYRMLYGAAGLYQFDPKTGDLTQILDSGVEDMIAEGDTAVYLTHAPGTHIVGMNKLGGDTIVRVNHVTNEKTTLVDASAGIPISHFSDAATVSQIAFETGRDVGMQHFNQYFYSYDEASGKIKVTDYRAGRPEVENGWDYEHPEAYKKAYIEPEQARLDEAWNSKK